MVVTIRKTTEGVSEIIFHCTSNEIKPHHITILVMISGGNIDNELFSNIVKGL